MAVCGGGARGPPSRCKVAWGVIHQVIHPHSLLVSVGGGIASAGCSGVSWQHRHLIWAPAASATPRPRTVYFAPLIFACTGQGWPAITPSTCTDSRQHRQAVVNVYQLRMAWCCCGIKRVARTVTHTRQRSTAQRRAARRPGHHRPARLVNRLLGPGCHPPPPPCGGRQSGCRSRRR